MESRNKIHDNEQIDSAPLCQDNSEVYWGKNRGVMEVDRLRERLIRELKERGKSGKEKGERMEETENIVKENRSCEHQIRCSTALLLSMKRTLLKLDCAIILSAQTKEKKLVKQILQPQLKSPFSPFVNARFKCGKRICVSPSFSVLPALLDQILLSLLAHRLEGLKMFCLSVGAQGYAAVHFYE